MRAEEGDESIKDFAKEAEKARDELDNTIDNEKLAEQADELGDATPGPR